jgi:hypothetical protein
VLELDTLVPAYAATIHKSQGSEYPAVVIPVMTPHYTMLQRNLIDTGVTRGRKLVVLVGQTRAVAIAVKNVSGRRRWSKLDAWLKTPTPPAGRINLQWFRSAGPREWRSGSCRNAPTASTKMAGYFRRREGSGRGGGCSTSTSADIGTTDRQGTSAKLYP